MPEIGTSGSTSGDGKRRVAAWPKRPRPSSTLPKRTWRRVSYFVRFRGKADMGRRIVPMISDAIDPYVWSGRALQEDFSEFEGCGGLASMYPAFDWSLCAPGHHGYQRACDLISG